MIGITEADLVAFLNQKIYEIGSIMMTYYNCCELQGATCRAGENLCCVNTPYGMGVCPFLQNGACQYANCDCKTWICETAINAVDPKCVEGLKLLQQFANLYGLIKTPMIGERYIGADKQLK